jgi:hypothetical protein
MKKVAVEKHAWSFTAALIVAVSTCAVSATGQIGKQDATIQTNTDTSPNQPQLFRDGKPWIPHGVQMVAFCRHRTSQRAPTIPRQLHVTRFTNRK